mgnify:CR=1 FL=1
MAGWEDIRAEVLSRIRSKAWPLGTLIPGEEALAQEFGVARATVNRALSELARSGVLERKRKAGTRVAALPVRFWLPQTTAEARRTNPDPVCPAQCGDSVLAHLAFLMASLQVGAMGR